LSNTIDYALISEPNFSENQETATERLIAVWRPACKHCMQFQQ